MDFVCGFCIFVFNLLLLCLLGDLLCLFCLLIVCLVVDWFGLAFRFGCSVYCVGLFGMVFDFDF